MEMFWIIALLLLALLVFSITLKLWCCAKTRENIKAIANAEDMAMIGRQTQILLNQGVPIEDGVDAATEMVIAGSDPSGPG